MKIVKIHKNEQPTGYLNESPELHVSFGKTLEPAIGSERGSILKNLVMNAGRRLQGVQSLIPREKLQSGPGPGMQGFAKTAIGHRLTRPEVAGMYDRLAAAGQLPESERGDERREFFLSVLEDAALYISPAFGKVWYCREDS